jgi:nitroreductase
VAAKGMRTRRRAVLIATRRDRPLNLAAMTLTPNELLTTTRAVRKRLDLSRPVERAVVEECVDIATQAPTGSNRQGWQFVFVDDPVTKEALADLYGRSFDPYIGGPQPEYPEGDSRREGSDRVRESARYLRQHFHEVPVMMVPCMTPRVAEEQAPVVMQASYWGSLLPAVWSFMLAARARGLGTAWTTLHLVYEREAAEVLGIPHADVAQGGLIPVAYTVGTDFKAAPRIPLDQVVHWNAW